MGEEAAAAAEPQIPDSAGAKKCLHMEVIHGEEPENGDKIRNYLAERSEVHTPVQ